MSAFVAKMSGQTNHKYADKMVNFYIALEATDRKAFGLVSANLLGPCLRSIQRRNARDSIVPFINHTPEDIKKALDNFIKITLKNVKKPVFSVAIDATKVPELISVSARYKALVGRSAPNHFINIRDGTTADELQKLIESNKKDLASEVKVAVVTFQSVPPGTCPFLIIAGRPQKNNQTTDFNEMVLNARIQYTQENQQASFISAANDGVSCDSKFVRSTIIRFLKGDIDQTGLTDPNHNIKNFRYQSIIGGNSIATIGNHCVDSGLLLVADVPEELWRVSDFASDLRVLRLASHATIQKVLSLTQEDPDSIITTCYTLYFMRCHLFGVNAKRERVITLTSKLFVLLPP